MHKIGRLLSFVAAMAVIICAGRSASAVTYGGIDFPQGAASFADEVLTYTPSHNGGPVPTDPSYTDPDEALGVPDYSAPTGSVSLGRGGLIELLFTDNVLTNSGSTDDDLHIFEVGPDHEATAVFVRALAGTADLLGPSADGFYALGITSGATSSLDLDSIFTGFDPGQLQFDAVRLIDEFNQGGRTGGTVGADIDAVGAIFSAAPPPPSPPPAGQPVPEPATAALGLMAALGLVSSLTRRRRGTA